MNWKQRAAHGLLRVHDLPAHTVREYPNRLAIWRKDGQRLGWEELQEIKSTVWGDTVAIEVYPRRVDTINLRHTRHLWSTIAIRDVVGTQCVHPEFDLPGTSKKG